MGIARRLVPGEAFGSVVHRPQPQFQRQSESRLFGATSGVGQNTATPMRQSCGTALPAGIGSPDSKVSEAVRVFTIAIVRGESSDRSAVGRDTGFGAYVLTACVHRDSRGEFRSPGVSSGRVRPVKTSSSG